jgi:hypothetical protein
LPVVISPCLLIAPAPSFRIRWPTCLGIITLR